MVDLNASGFFSSSALLHYSIEDDSLLIGHPRRGLVGLHLQHCYLSGWSLSV